MLFYKIPNFVFVSAVLCVAQLTRIMASSDLVRGNEKFGKNLYNLISQTDGNLICSPISAHIALSMAAAGADGETKTALTTALGINDPMDAATGYETFLNDVEKSKSQVTLDIANKIFLMKDFGLNPTFNEIMIKNYKSEVQEVDFSQSTSAAGTINEWVENKTNKKIKDLINSNSLNRDTRLVLVNAIYFKGKWAKQFRPEATRDESFYLLDGSEIKCQMMHITAKYDYMEDDNLKAKILKMDYTDDSMSMLFFLPHERDGLKHLEANIQNFDFQNFKSNMATWEVDVAIPRFKTESEIKLTDILKKMNLDIIFTDNANFKKIASNGEGLKVSEVIQKAMVEVNEEGAEAAAATGMEMMKRSARPPKMEFEANHPFMVTIIFNKPDEKLTHFLFLARILNPIATETTVIGSTNQAIKQFKCKCGTNK